MTMMLLMMMMRVRWLHTSIRAWVKAMAGRRGKQNLDPFWWAAPLQRIG